MPDANYLDTTGDYQGQIYSPTAIAARRAMARELMGSRPEGPGIPGLASGIDNIMGALMWRKANQQEQAGLGAARNLGAGTAASYDQPTPAPTPQQSNAPSQQPNAYLPHAGDPASTDPVAEGLQPQEKAMLNAVAAPESGGKYNIRYTPNGGATFEGDQHPNIPEPTADGRQSTAAGRYQITHSSWKDGLPDQAIPFTPANQDMWALNRMRTDYAKATGGNLDADVQKNGWTPQISKALAGTWQGLGTNPQRAQTAFNDSMARYKSQVTGGDLPDQPGIQSRGPMGAPMAPMNPAAIHAAQEVIRNPSVATPEQIQQANETLKNARTPPEPQNMGGGNFRDPITGQLTHMDQPQIITDAAGNVLSGAQGAQGQFKPAHQAPPPAGMGGPPALEGQVGAGKLQIDPAAEQQKIAQGDIETGTQALFQRTKVDNIAQDIQDYDAATKKAGDLGAVFYRGPIAANPIVKMARDVAVQFGLTPQLAAVRIAGDNLTSDKAALANIVKEAAGTGRFSTYEYKSISQSIADLGTAPGAGEHLIHSLRNMSERDQLLGNVGNAFTNGHMDFEDHRNLRQLITADPDVASHVLRAANGAVQYTSPSGKKYRFGGGM